MKKLFLGFGLIVANICFAGPIECYKSAASDSTIAADLSSWGMTELCREATPDPVKCYKDGKADAVVGKLSSMSLMSLCSGKPIIQMVRVQGQ